MDKNILLQVCQKYDIGTPVEDVSPVVGGLLHKMWHLKTDKGEYAVKELNADILARPGVAESFKLSESVANKLSIHDVPVVTGLAVDDTAVQNIAGTFVIVYEWVNGTTLSTGAATPEQAFQIGKSIGEIHKVNVNEPALSPSLPVVFPNEHWQKLITELETTYPELIFDYEQISKWNERASDIVGKLKSHVVVSHDDIDQKNILWDAYGQPHIIDWESVSKTNPGLEIVDAALNWGGLVSGEVRTESMKALIEGYRSTGMSITEDSTLLLNACIIKWLSWLEFNLQRMLKHSPETDEHKLGFAQTQSTLRNIRLISQNVEDWARLLN